MNRYDLFCFTETKTDDLDIIELYNYVLFAKTECKYVYWFRVKGELFNCESDVLFGFVYIPHQCSNYSSSEAFNEIELEYLNLITQYDYVCLTGDFNARVSDKKDYFEKSYLSYFEVSIDIECDILTDVHKLNIFNINIDRKSCYKKTIFIGNQLLNFCKTNS